MPPADTGWTAMDATRTAHAAAAAVAEQAEAVDAAASAAAGTAQRDRAAASAEPTAHGAAAGNTEPHQDQMRAAAGPSGDVLGMGAPLTSAEQLAYLSMIQQAAQQHTQ
ncbi:hypothetical protein OEZ85_007388 [Tetradesmus obliquus]|uniref:Uncharacterized protein n=1 Tax=Tetradesmus obliquus TaxID=3088 RepID=A0ABY8TG92_TETOB|nr:hypothetical protein OEZ85_007388 [Tetradesmus obliquus]